MGIHKIAYVVLLLPKTQELQWGMRISDTLPSLQQNHLNSNSILDYVNQKQAATILQIHCLYDVSPGEKHKERTSTDFSTNKPNVCNEP